MSRGGRKAQGAPGALGELFSSPSTCSGGYWGLVAWEKPGPPPDLRSVLGRGHSQHGGAATRPSPGTQSSFFQAFLLLWEVQSCSTSGAGGLPGPPRGSPAPGCRWPHPRRAPAPCAAPGLCLFPPQVTFVPVHPEAEWFLADKPTVPTERDSPGKLWYVPALLLVRVSSWVQGCPRAARTKGRVSTGENHRFWGINPKIQQGKG